MKGKDFKNYILHSGVKRKSGRYEWGSGEHPYQHEPWFQGWAELNKTMTVNEIAHQYGMSQKELLARYGYAKDAQKAALITHAIELRNVRQMSVAAIAKKMNVSQSTVKSWLAPNALEKTKRREDLANALIKEVNKKKYIDVGKGVESVLGVKRTMLDDVLIILKDRGYNIIKFDQAQASDPKRKTHMMVLMQPKEGMDEAKAKSESYKELMQNKSKIDLPYDVRVNENGKTIYGIHQPVSISSKRIMVRYGDDPESGSKREGLIEIRRGVDDLYLGNCRYAQVRIAVDDTHYLKGMAVYKDDMPPGVDIIVNTTKKRGTPLCNPDPNGKTVAKPMVRDANGNIDKDNPFGAQIKSPGGQYFYTDKNGEKKLGAINKVNSEEDWNDWTSSKTLASQILTKQDVGLAKRQLNLAHAQYADELAEIQKITNPIVKAQRLNEFAENCDKAAVHMKAAAMPGQSVKVLIPIPSLKDNEVYCPAYNNGEKLALFRYPHGCKSEIPILTVNNGNREGRKVMTNAPTDAIGINPKAAERLSGADFDGDTVVVIPNRKGLIKNEGRTAELWNDFDPHTQFANPPGTPRPSQTFMYTQMGIVTNLITDMTLQNATEEEVARVVKHSQVIIDAYKHNLDWKRSEQEYRIQELHEKYQGKATGGAYTIISKATGEVRVPDRDRFRVNPKTGEKEWHYTGKKRVYQVDPVTGEKTKNYKELLPYQKGYDPEKAKNYEENLKNKYVPLNKTPKLESDDINVSSKRMAEVKDAMDLVSPMQHPMEIVYANYANSMKAMANEARLEALKNDHMEVNKQAQKTYAKEVDSLKEKIRRCETQAPLERRVQLLTSVIVEDMRSRYPERYNSKTPDGKKALRKLRSQVQLQQRCLLKGETHFQITDKEWEAVQAGAVNKSTLLKVLRYAEKDRITELATPHDSNLPALSMANIAHAKAMLNSNFTQAEVAAYFGVSVSTLRRAMSK